MPLPLLGTDAASAPATSVPTLANLATEVVSYEPVRRRLTLTAGLSLIGPNHAATPLSAPAIVLETRTLRTAGATYSYVVTEDGWRYGFVKQSELDARSEPIPPSAPPRGFLAALTTLTVGKAKKDAFGTWNVNSGVTHVGTNGASKVIAITTDLCPNFARFEHGFFEELSELGRARGAPIPVTAFVSGLWLAKGTPRRAAEVDELKTLATTGAVSLTFGNHSFSHPYLKAASMARNFLLKPGVDFQHETLGNELAMMKSELMPAPLFRFPGLITNTAEEDRAREHYSMVVVGSGSWPGTGQPINFGDVVLVHANGGEHAGIVRLEDWLHANRAAIVSGEIDFVGGAGLGRPVATIGH